MSLTKKKLFNNKNIRRVLFTSLFMSFVFLIAVFCINLYLFNKKEPVIEASNSKITLTKSTSTIEKEEAKNQPIDFSRFGQFGDFMGGILNPIFMFLTLIALILTIVLQRKELKLSRKEYSKTSKALNIQVIENTFFNSINLHYRIVENLKINFSDFDERFLTEDIKQLIIWGSKDNPLSGEYTGIKVFDKAITKIFNNTDTPLQTLEKYKILQDDYNYIFGHYFRNLYEALKLIDKNDYLEKSEKKKYSSILRAQLSSSELTLLFLNCLNSVYDNQEFKDLLITYQMFEHLDINYQDDGYIISRNIKVSKEMVLQYFRKVNELKLDLVKNVGGAYGRNNKISSSLIKYENRELYKQGKKVFYTMDNEK